MTAPNPSTALATTVVDELVRNGVSRFVIAPGSRSAALALAAASHPQVSPIVAIDERSAGFHALGIGKAGGMAAVVVTSGTACANLFPAVVEAELSYTGMILLTADRPPELRDVGANQTFDQVRLFGRHVRWFTDLGPPEDIPGANAFWRSTVCRAVAEARGWRAPPGPVHLNLAFREPVVPLTDDGRTIARVFGSDTEGRAGGAPWTVTVGSAPAPRRPPPVLEQARRVLVVVGDVGAGVASDRVLELGWPVVAEPHSGARRPGAISTAHHILGHPATRQRLRPDVVVRIGRTGLSRPVGNAIRDVASQVVIDARTWSDPDHLAGWLGDGTWGLGPADEAWVTEWRAAEAAVRQAVDATLDGFDVVTEPRTARDAAAAVPEGGVLVAASSLPIRELDVFMRPTTLTVVANRGVSGIDGFVSTALGVATTGRPVVALAGDLSMLHDQNGFLVTPRPSAVFVVVDNDGGGIFSFLPQASLPEHFELVFGTPHGRSFEQYAAFHELGYERVDRPERLAPAITERVAAGGVHLVAVETDRSDNLAVHQRLRAVAHQALDRLTPGPGASPGA